MRGDGFGRDRVDHGLERGGGVFVADVLGDGEAVPPESGGGYCAVTEHRGRGEGGVGGDVGVGLGADGGPGERTPLVHDGDLTRVPDLVEFVGVIGQVIRSHVADHGAHGFKDFAAVFVVDRQVRGAGFEEVSAGAEVEVHEFGGEVPAGFTEAASGFSMMPAARIASAAARTSA